MSKFKISKARLAEIIREEYARLINEAEEEMSETEALDGKKSMDSVYSGRLNDVFRKIANNNCY